jgi:hypothetical protein
MPAGRRNHHKDKQKGLRRIAYNISNITEPAKRVAERPAGEERSKTPPNPRRIRRDKRERRAPQGHSPEERSGYVLLGARFRKAIKQITIQ